MKAISASLNWWLVSVFYALAKILPDQAKFVAFLAS